MQLKAADVKGSDKSGELELIQVILTKFSVLCNYALSSAQHGELHALAIQNSQRTLNRFLSL